MRIKKTSFIVLVHRVCVASVNTMKQAEAIETIYKQNKGLRSKVDIIRVAWLKRTLKLGKKVALLHLSVAELVQANHLIDYSLISDY